MQKYQKYLIVQPLLFISCFIFSSTMQDDIRAAFQGFIGPIHCYSIEPLKGGMSNNVQYLCIVNEKRYVVRLLNESYIERKNEILIHLHFATQKIAPRVYYYSDDYSFIIMDFIDDHTLTVEDAQKENVLKSIADTIRCIHKSCLDCVLKEDIDKRDVRHDIIRWYNVTKKNNSCLPIELEAAFNTLDFICNVLEKESLPLMLSHNDLHPRNIFFIHDNIVVIDWELVGMNYAFFDLANYCMYACLDESKEHYLLTSYLERNPTLLELHCFRCVKLLSFLFNIFGLLACLGPISQNVQISEDFEYYATIFSQNKCTSELEFTFSLLKKFFCEYKSFVSKLNLN